MKVLPEAQPLIRDDAAAWAGDRLSGPVTNKMILEYASFREIPLETAKKRLRRAKADQRAARRGLKDSGTPPNVSELERARRYISLLERERVKMLQTLSDKQWFVEQVKDHLAALKPLPPYVEPKTKAMTKEQEVVHLLSDGQLGERVYPDETGGIGGEHGYDIDVFSKRLTYWAEKSVSILKHHRRITPIRVGHLFELGDMLEGQSIFKGQSTRLDDNIVGQFVRGADLLSGAIRFLSGHYEQLKIEWLLGNHGRVGEKGENLHYVNYEYLLAQMVKEKLQECTNIVWNIPKSWWVVVPIQGWKFYLTHGEDLQSYLGIPWYAMERMDGRVTLMLQELGVQFDYMVMGHHHNCVQWDRPRGERIVNGTFVSGNAFAAKKLKTNCRPTQLMFAVHPEQGITWRYPIRLDQ